MNTSQSGPMNSPAAADSCDAEIAGIILAAGRSRRMGTSKAFLPWSGSTFAGTIAANLRQAGARPLAAVFRGAEIERAKNESALEDFELVLNNDEREEGPISSIRAAILALFGPGDWAPFSSPRPGRPAAKRCIGALICPVDHPAVLPSTYTAIIAAARANPGRIIRPEAGSPRLPGHPCFFPREVFAALFSAPYGQGAVWALEQHPGRVAPLFVDDLGVLCNINTQAAYEECGKFQGNAAQEG